MNQSSPCPKKFAARGLSLIEILIALGLFGTAVVGLYWAVYGINQRIAFAMKRDIEAAYASRLMASINPYNINVETAYDSTSTSCGGGTSRCSVSLPNGDSFYYTLGVSSSATSPDVRQVTMYLYADSTGGTPYRRFERNLPVQVMGYDMEDSGNGGLSAETYIDKTGQHWIVVQPSNTYSIGTAGSYKGGLDSVSNGGAITGNTQTGNSNNVSNSIDTSSDASKKHIVWRSYHIGNGGNDKLVYRFPASRYHSYLISLGFNDDVATAAGQRLFDIYINDTKVTSSPVDIYDESGGQYYALVKTYSATAQLNGAASVYTIKVELRQNGGDAGKKPILSWVTLHRN